MAICYRKEEPQQSHTQLIRTWKKVRVSGFIEASIVINRLLIIVARIEKEYQMTMAIDT